MTDPKPLELLVRKLGLRAPLSEDDCRAILALPFVRKSLEAGAYLVRDGEAPPHSTILLSGFAYRQKLTGMGTRQIISLLIPGEAVDFQSLFLDSADHNVQMLTRGEVALVPRIDLQDLIRAHGAVGRAILIKTLVEASIFREWILNIGRRDARARLAHVLCELATRLEAQGLAVEYGYELPMTQEQLADALGRTAVHVNRVLKSLEADGLIVRTNRSISFPDWNRMTRVADFDGRYLHLGRQHARNPSSAAET